MNATAEVIDFTKKCSACSETKSMSDFYRRRASRDGLGAHCKTCDDARPRKWRKQHFKPRSEEQKRLRQERQNGIYRSYDLKRKYGLTLDEAREMLRRQFGLCANRACGKNLYFDIPKSEPGKAMVDHCHATGRVRGILCFQCNTLAGRLEKNQNLVVGINEYLARNFVGAA